MLTIFFIAVSFILYTYLGYPLLLRWLKTFSPPVGPSPEILPEVSLIIPVYNEERVLRRKIENSLRLDYPEEKLKIVVVSDGSTDRSVAIARSFAAVTVLEYPGHRGKMSALNHAVSTISTEVVAFTDASAFWREDALRELVAPLADPAVGAVSGELILKEEETRGGELRVDWYWRLEKYIRKQESRIFSCLGATGAIYLLRRSLFQPLPEDTILDDMLIPLGSVQRGYRILFESRARAVEEGYTNLKLEFRRKVRTLVGNYQIFFRSSWALIPGKSKVAFQLISHKLFRLLVPFALLGIFISSLLGPAVLLPVLLLQFIFYGLAGYGLSAAVKGRPSRKIFSLPLTFCLLNTAAFQASVIYFFRKKPPVWK